MAFVIKNINGEFLFYDVTVMPPKWLPEHQIQIAYQCDSEEEVAAIKDKLKEEIENQIEKLNTFKHLLKYSKAIRITEDSTRSNE